MCISLIWGYFLNSGIYQCKSGVFFQTVMCCLQIYVTMPCTYRMMSCEPLERPQLTSWMDHPQEGKRWQCRLYYVYTEMN